MPELTASVALIQVGNRMVRPVLLFPMQPSQMWAVRLQVTGCLLSLFSAFSSWSLLCLVPWVADSLLRAGSSGCHESEARLSLWP